MLLARGISGGLRVCLLFGSLQPAAVPQEGETGYKWLHFLEANQSSNKGSGPAKYVYCSGNAFVLKQHLSPKISEHFENIKKDVFEPGFGCSVHIAHTEFGTAVAAWPAISFTAEMVFAAGAKLMLMQMQLRW